MRAYLTGVGPARNDLSRFRKLLDRAGVRAIASGVPQADCPALVYFTDASAELLATLRVVRERGTDRILAVAGPGAAPVPEAAWELMHAGASDVIAWDSYGEPVQAIVSRLDRWRQVDQLIASEAVRSRLVGAGQRWIGLLRVIQEGMYKRVGSDTWRTTDFRLVCATNRDLIKEQEAGRFRLDLYYRIAAWQFRLPPLRHRPEDIEPLAASFLSRLSANGAAPDMESAVRTLLRTRDYPGNIRDLRQLVERISQRHVGPGPITVGDVPEDDRPTQACTANSGAGRVPWHVGEFENSVRKAIAVGVGLREIASVAAETAVSIALAESGGSQVRAARLLGVTPRALQLRRSAGRGVRAVPLDPDRADPSLGETLIQHGRRYPGNSPERLHGKAGWPGHQADLSGPGLQSAD